MSHTPTDQEADQYLRQKIKLLPPRFQPAIHWLLRPGSRWARWPVAFLFICGGILWFLPIVGFWMLPLGLLLIAEDIPSLKRWFIGVLMSAEARWHRWQSRRRPP